MILFPIEHPEKFLKFGMQPSKGVLFYGPPGCGKTLLAKAVAGEAGCTFISASGSDFDEMYVGVGASRIRKLFETARQKAPCVIFIDEIDALGQSRENVLMSTLDKKPDPDTDLYGYVRVKHTPPHKPLNPRPSLKERSILDIFTKRTVEIIFKPSL